MGFQQVDVTDLRSPKEAGDRPMIQNSGGRETVQNVSITSARLLSLRQAT